MFSTIQKTLSDVLSSLTSSKEPPRLLQRPTSDVQSLSNDPARSPATARMPHSRSNTSSNTDTKPQKGAKATQFLIQNFDTREDDPIETSSPPEPRVRRIKPGRRLSGTRRQESSPNSTRYDGTNLNDGNMTDGWNYFRPKAPPSKPQLHHQYLIVDADERALFAGNAPPDSAAVLIPGPNLRKAIRKPSSPTMPHGPILRPVNTLDNTNNNQVSPALGRRLQNPSSTQWRPSGSRKYITGPDASSSTKNGTGEPPSKRPRLDPSMKPYVKDEGAGAVSPMFSSISDEDIVMTVSRPVRTPSKKPPRPNKISEPLPIPVAEYQSVEETMQNNNSKRNALVGVSPPLPSKPLHGNIQHPDDSDPEEFTRASKKARYQQRINDDSATPLESHRPSEEPYEKQNGRNTPPVVSNLFTAGMLPSDGEGEILEGEEHPKYASAAGSAREHVNQHSTNGTSHHSSTAVAGVETTRSRTAAKAVTGNKSKVRSKTANPGAGTFDLRQLKYGFLPGDRSYTAVVADNSMRLYDDASLLSEEPLWPGIQLRKIYRVSYGSNDCLKLKLHMSHCQGQPSSQMDLEFNSRQAKEDFISLVLGVGHNPSKMQRDDEYLRKSFEHKPEVDHRALWEGIADEKRQPISSQRQASGTTSHHFQDEETNSTKFPTRPAKLIDQLQTSTSTSRRSGADVRIPTVISGKDRANQSYPASAQTTPAVSANKYTFDQAQISNASRLRSSSTRIAAARSHPEAGMSNRDVEEAPKEKYSAVYGLGEPWKIPLTYPPTGKRRMAVEFADLLRLDEDEFLNDNLIGFFLRYLEYHLEQNRPEIAQRVYFYNSYFYERLMQTSKGQKGINYGSVQKWTRNIDIFERDFVIVPVNESYHWYVVIICNLSKLNSITNNEGDHNEEDTTLSREAVVPLEEKEDEARTDVEATETHDQPTEKTTESLSHLSLSDVDKQTDELASSSKAVSAYFSPQPGSVSKKSGRGRRKGRHSLAKYNVFAPVIMTFDSLGTPRSSTCTALRQYLVEEARSKKGWEIDGGHIKGMTARGIPTQPNFYDCGLYLCAYLEKFILNPAGFVRKILQREMDQRGHADNGKRRAQKQDARVSQRPSRRAGGATSPDNTNIPRSALQNDSEDELQQDQISARILNAIQASHKEATPPRDPLAKDQASSITGSPVAYQPSKKRLPSKSSVFFADAFANVNIGAPVQPRSGVGTREAAITIDDDDDSQPVPESVSAKKKAPVAKDDFFKHGSSEKIGTHHDDFFEHPSELKDTTSVSKKSVRRRSRDASIVVELPPRRSPSTASADTVNTDFLSGSANKSYQHGKDEPNAGHATSEKAERLPARSEVVVLVPDSQESREVEGEEGEVEWQGLREEGTREDDQEILEGID
ncbi:hypothetical protein EPUS_03236 [Endocarpon pusillum Z07020]|uniref:Ubiquitin-like protease family profile domain-containing protein n=1 Tax=Endocarpon pusillum (strain Z07020 / HMAS-L-300199) TaxID=1263415 RepID=U1GBC9_ENDPU|nr:uncharacterized protein EPUS_03236 [Endocarpon pusillum Z07020]ERF74852.1 hypothetical protein EPUS_03236 [Endocarpon pusillum Z07020]